MRRGVNNSAWLLYSDKGAEGGQVGAVERKTPLEPPICNLRFISVLINQEEQSEGIPGFTSCLQEKGQCNGAQPGPESQANPSHAWNLPGV